VPLNSNLILRQVTLNRDMVKNFDEYPFNIDVVKNFDSIELTKPVTFFIGENGIGKSTFIEAIAVALGLNAEGGTQNFNFCTQNTTSTLSNFLKLSLSRRPKTKFFLRAESFYNFATEVETLELFDSYGNLHKCSHGESFLKLVQNRFTENGLYILDEPEAALSPDRQMTLLCLIDNLVKNGSQFIIATHSPILTSYRNGEILDLNNNFDSVEYKQSSIYRTYKMYLDNVDEMQHRLLD